MPPPGMLDNRVVDSRMLTGRERAVLEALLAVDFDGVRVVGGCGCGCPSIEFMTGGAGMRPRVNAFPDGTYSSLFLYSMVDAGGVEVLGGIEWAGIDESPDQFPPPGSLTLEAA